MTTEEKIAAARKTDPVLDVMLTLHERQAEFNASIVAMLHRLAIDSGAASNESFCDLAIAITENASDPEHHQLRNMAQQWKKGAEPKRTCLRLIRPDETE